MITSRSSVLRFSFRFVSLGLCFFLFRVAYSVFAALFVLCFLSTSQEQHLRNYLFSKMTYFVLNGTKNLNSVNHRYYNMKK